MGSGKRGERGSDEASTRSKGMVGEAIAATLLEAAGLDILERNVTRAGAEIDLIAREGQTIVFIEVRRRADTGRGHPFETVGARKQARVRRAASAWLVEAKLWDKVAVRFDVVAIVGERPEWLRDAF